MRLIPFVDNPEKADNDQGKVAKLQAMYTAADQERKKAEQEWFANACALAGKQGPALAKDVLINRRININAPRLARLNLNLIYPLVRQAAAAGVDNAADQIAIAATSDPDDIQAAELATDLIAHRYAEDDEYNVRLHEELWRLTCGFSVRHTYWDEEKDGYGRLGVIPKAGDIATEIITPLNVHVCPWVDSSKPRPWYIISDVRDTDEINDIYKPKTQVLPEEYAEHSRILDQLLSNVVVDTISTPPKRKHAAILKRLYHKPGKNFPNGRVWIWSNGVLLDEPDLSEGQLPFVERLWFPVPGRIYPYPFITPLVGLCEEINKTVSQMVELKNRQLRGDMVVQGNPPTEEEVSPVSTEWDPETGQKIIYLDNTVQEFKLMEYNLNTVDAQALIALKWENMQRIAGLHDPSTGETAGIAQTATEVAVLKEADTAGLALFRNMANHQQSKIEQQKILLAKNHYHIERAVRVVGESAIPKVKYFFNAELRNTDDVRPRPAPLLTEAMKAQIRAQLAEKMAWDFTGAPTMIANKVQMILNSGLPDAQEEIEKMIGPLTVDDVFKAAGMSVQQQITVGLQQGEMMQVQNEAMMQGATGGEEAPQGVMAQMAA